MEQLISIFFKPLEVVSRNRDPQPQVVENCSYLFNFQNAALFNTIELLIITFSLYFSITYKHDEKQTAHF